MRILTWGVVDVVQPTLPWPWLTTPLCMLVVLNLFTHYYLVCTIPPGFVDEPRRLSESDGGWMWATKKTQTRRTQSTGVQWSEELNVTKAVTSRCKRCAVMRPEVRRIYGELLVKYADFLRAREPITVEYASVAC